MDTVWKQGLESSVMPDARCSVYLVGVPGTYDLPGHRPAVLSPKVHRIDCDKVGLGDHAVSETRAA